MMSLSSGHSRGINATPRSAFQNTRRKLRQNLFTAEHRMHSRNNLRRNATRCLYTTQLRSMLPSFHPRRERGTLMERGSTMISWPGLAQWKGQCGIATPDCHTHSSLTSRYLSNDSGCLPSSPTILLCTHAVRSAHTYPHPQGSVGTFNDAAWLAERRDSRTD